LPTEAYCPHLVVGGPNWLEDDRYDVDAKAEGTASQDERRQMLKALGGEVQAGLPLPGERDYRVPAHGRKERSENEGAQAGRRWRAVHDTGSGKRALHLPGYCDEPASQFSNDDQSRTTRARQDGSRRDLDFDLNWGQDAGLDQQHGIPQPFNAIEDVGLKLQSAKEPVDFLIIDHVEKPSDN
jgi:hypothetical protein